MSVNASIPTLVRLNTLVLPNIELNPEEVQCIFESTGAAHAFQAFPWHWVFLYDSFETYMKAMGTELEFPPIGVRTLERKVKLTIVADDGPWHRTIFLQVHDLAFVENPKTQMFAVKFSLDVIGFHNLNDTLSFENYKKYFLKSGMSIFHEFNGTVSFEDFLKIKEIITNLKNKCLEELDHTLFIKKFNEELRFADHQKEVMNEEETLKGMLAELEAHELAFVEGMDKMILTYEHLFAPGIQLKHRPVRLI